MPPIDVVADASVVLKWFHAEGEEEVDEARQLIELHRRQAIAVSVIDLTAYEIGNALLRGRPHIAADRVAIVIESLSDICPRLTLSGAELTDAVTLAEAHGLTVYDAAYVAAARSRDARLATLDRGLLRARLGQRPSELLNEFGLEIEQYIVAAGFDSSSCSAGSSCVGWRRKWTAWWWSSCGCSSRSLSGKYCVAGGLMAIGGNPH